MPERQEVQHLGLARREDYKLVGFGVRSPTTSSGAFREQGSGERRVDVALARVHGADGPEEFRRRRAFERVSRGARAQETRDVSAFLMHREDENFDAWKISREAFRRLGAAAVRHGHVEKQDVGLQLLGEPPRLLTTVCLADDHNTRLGIHQGAQTLADDNVVVGD